MTQVCSTDTLPSSACRQAGCSTLQRAQMASTARNLQQEATEPLRWPSHGLCKPPWDVRICRVPVRNPPPSPIFFPLWAVIWGGAKRMGGGKRTRERALRKIFGPLQKSFWSALSWIFVQEKQGPKPLFGRGVIREVFHTPLFSTPPWHPLMDPCLFGFPCVLSFQGIPCPFERFPLPFPRILGVRQG